MIVFTLKELVWLFFFFYFYDMKEKQNVFQYIHI